MENKLEDILQKSINTIHGVGKAREDMLNKLGIFTIFDAIFFYPRRYEDRTAVKFINQLEDGESCVVKGKILSNVKRKIIKKNLHIFEVAAKDTTGAIILTWFNQAYIATSIKMGQEYYFYGTVNKKYGIIKMESPIFENADNQVFKNVCRIVPIYSLVKGISQNILKSIIKNCLILVSGKFQEVLPDWIRQKYELAEVNYAAYNIHFPDTDEDFKKSRYRLAFEELLVLQLGLLMIKHLNQSNIQGISFNKVTESKTFIANLDFELTNAQNKVFEEIEFDMESNKPMNRLVQGDVGSGKTIVAVLALFKVVKSGYQGAFMAPTGILAMQQYNSLTKIMSKYDIKIGLLTGDLSSKKKSIVLEQIKDGKVDIVVGTHAIIEEEVEFKNLGLVVTDEQHRFGVKQRAKIAQKGSRPDVIVMTATPIPRTLALILYGDLDISIIDQMPPGRKPVKTYAVNEHMRDRINDFIQKIVDKGRQVYVICPLIEESEKIEAKAAEKFAKHMRTKYFPQIEIGLIHGKMKSQEKETIMKDFVDGNIKILVSTTVIEVGVDVPNAALILIENAERFGLAQLHQLRGRVGRGTHESYCILINESNSKIARNRMKVMETSNDGFEISKKDMEIRGPGDFFGVRQHGLPELKIANLYEDVEMLEKVRNVAEEILKQDENLQKPENQPLKKLIKRFFAEKMKDLILN